MVDTIHTVHECVTLRLDQLVGYNLFQYPSIEIHEQDHSAFAYCSIMFQEEKQNEEI